MQLDKTHVAIRVRTLSEIGDLALLMIRRYPRAFFHAFFLGASLWFLVDLLILGWLPLQFTYEEFFDADVRIDALRYVFWWIVLVVVQTPLAGAFTTYYLGQAVFEQRPTIRKTVTEVISQFWPAIWVLGIRRMAIPLTVLAAMRWDQPADTFYDAVLPITLLIIAALMRSNRPFVPEMILLEQCPLRSKSGEVITLSRRSKALHTPMASELGGRFLAVSMTLAVLTGCVYYTFMWVRGIAVGVWANDLLAMWVFFPMALWLIASLSVFVRILGYLDARIRLEGWEVELAIRAEAIRQFGEDSMSLPEMPRASVNAVGKDASTPSSQPDVPSSSGSNAASGNLQLPDPMKGQPVSEPSEAIQEAR